MKLRRAL
nr:unnamed protein product [Callosobruchus chinensis]